MTSQGYSLKAPSVAAQMMKNLVGTQIGNCHKFQGEKGETEMKQILAGHCWRQNISLGGLSVAHLFLDIDIILDNNIQLDKMIQL